MKTLKEFEKEINKVLSNKIAAAIKDLEGQRGKDMEELMKLHQALEDLENKKAPFLQERGGLNVLKNTDLGRRNFLDQHIPWLEKQAKGVQDQIEKLMQKLTELEVDSKTLNFLLHFKL
jgi:chromosome segregation ATPase